MAIRTTTPTTTTTLASFPHGRPTPTTSANGAAQMRSPSLAGPRPVNKENDRADSPVRRAPNRVAQMVSKSGAARPTGMSSAGPILKRQRLSYGGGSVGTSEYCRPANDLSPLRPLSQSGLRSSDCSPSLPRSTVLMSPERLQLSVGARSAAPSSGSSARRNKGSLEGENCSRGASIRSRELSSGVSPLAPQSTPTALDSTAASPAPLEAGECSPPASPKGDVESSGSPDVNEETAVSLVVPRADETQVVETAGVELVAATSDPVDDLKIAVFGDASASPVKEECSEQLLVPTAVEVSPATVPAEAEDSAKISEEVEVRRSDADTAADTPVTSACTVACVPAAVVDVPAPVEETETEEDDDEEENENEENELPRVQGSSDPAELPRDSSDDEKAIGPVEAKSGGSRRESSAGESDTSSQSAKEFETYKSVSKPAGNQSESSMGVKPSDAATRKIWEICEEYEKRGLLTGIPVRLFSQIGRGDQGKIRNCNIPITPVTYYMLKNGYDLRLGEKGRSDLKQEISKKTRTSPSVKEECARVARLKHANIYQLLQLAEICGILDSALEISQTYWKESTKKTKARRSRSGAHGDCSDDAMGDEGPKGLTSTAKSGKSTRGKTDVAKDARGIADLYDASRLRNSPSPVTEFPDPSIRFMLPFPPGFGTSPAGPVRQIGSPGSMRRTDEPLEERLKSLLRSRKGLSAESDIYPESLSLDSQIRNCLANMVRFDSKAPVDVRLRDLMAEVGFEKSRAAFLAARLTPTSASLYPGGLRSSSTSCYFSSSITGRSDAAEGFLRTGGSHDSPPGGGLPAFPSLPSAMNFGDRFSGGLAPLIPGFSGHSPLPPLLSSVCQMRSPSGSTTTTKIALQTCGYPLDPTVGEYSGAMHHRMAASQIVFAQHNQGFTSSSTTTLTTGCVSMSQRPQAGTAGQANEPTSPRKFVGLEDVDETAANANGNNNNNRNPIEQLLSLTSQNVNGVSTPSSGSPVGHSPESDGGSPQLRIKEEEDTGCPGGSGDMSSFPQEFEISGKETRGSSGSFEGALSAGSRMSSSTVAESQDLSGGKSDTPDSAKLQGVRLNACIEARGILEVFADRWSLNSTESLSASETATGSLEVGGAAFAQWLHQVAVKTGTESEPSTSPGGKSASENSSVATEWEPSVEAKIEESQSLIFEKFLLDARRIVGQIRGLLPD